MSLPTYPLTALAFDCAGDSIYLLLRTILVSCCLMLSGPTPNSIILFVCSFSLTDSITITSSLFGDLKLLLFGTEEYAAAVFSTDLAELGANAFLIICARRLDPSITLEEGRSAL
jgi:hypothetical protein